MINKATTIAARVVATGQHVQVDDHPLWFGFVKVYNMWHTDTDGNVWCDDDLEFLEERLQ